MTACIQELQSAHGVFSLLNEAQHRAVTHGSGPLLVLAGAGTGKTRVLVHRLLWLLDQGVSPESILLLTFTRRAAQDMLRRAAELSGKSFAKVEGGTFHAVGSRILRRYGRHIGLQPDFTVIDRSDAESIIQSLRPSCPAKLKSPDAKTVLNILSASVNKSVPVADLVRQHSQLFEFVSYFVEIEQRYAAYKAASRLMDYDDLLVFWRRLLLESPYAAEKITGLYQHVLIDEYQDTNLLQAAIVRLLSSCHGNVTAVGDEAQSIYSFRGADVDNILRFQAQFPGTVEIRLEQNYRSLPPVLNLANAVMPGKHLHTASSGGSLPVVYPAFAEQDEAFFVVSNLQRLLDQGVPLSEIAVLYRTAHCPHCLELELLAQGIPYEKRGGIKLTFTDQAKDVLAFFRVKVNPHDRLSWQRIFKQIDWIGSKIAFRLADFICQHSSPFEQLGFVHPQPSWRIGFNRLFELCRKLQNCKDPLEFFDLVMVYYAPIFIKKYPEDSLKRMLSLDTLRDRAASYYDIGHFVEDVALDPPEAESSASSDRLILSTVHSAKGLEFQAVFIIGLVETCFPARCFSPAQREEERRMFYVAVTRAREQLFLSWPSVIQNIDRTTCHAVMSPFLRVPPALLRTETMPF